MNNENGQRSNGNNNGGDKGSGQGNGSPRRQSFFLLLVAALVTLLVMSFLMRSLGADSSKEITYDEFLNMVKEGKVERVVITDREIDIIPKSEDKKQEQSETDTVLQYIYGTNQRQSGVTYYTGIVNDDDLPAFLNKYGVSYKQKIPDNSGLLMSILLTYILPIVLVC